MLVPLLLSLCGLCAPFAGAAMADREALLIWKCAQGTGFLSDSWAGLRMEACVALTCTALARSDMGHLRYALHLGQLGALWRTEEDDHERELWMEGELHQRLFEGGEDAYCFWSGRFLDEDGNLVCCSSPAGSSESGEAAAFEECSGGEHCGRVWEDATEECHVEWRSPPRGAAALAR